MAHKAGAFDHDKPDAVKRSATMDVRALSDVRAGARCAPYLATLAMLTSTMEGAPLPGYEASAKRGKSADPKAGAFDSGQPDAEESKKVRGAPPTGLHDPHLVVLPISVTIAL